jgi:hypothetical protein
MEDISPKLLEELQEAFRRNLEGLEFNGNSYASASAYSADVGEALANAFSEILKEEKLPNGRMYWNIAKKTVEPMLQQNYNLAADAAAVAQRAVYQDMGLGLNPVRPEFNQDKANGLMNKVCQDVAYSKLSKYLEEPVVNFTQSVVDDAVKANAEFGADIGLVPKIRRIETGSCCDWCKALAGTYDYPENTPDGIFRRHKNCRCIVEYDPGNGKKQNVHTKKWSDAGTVQEREKLAENAEQEYKPVNRGVSKKFKQFRGETISAKEIKGYNDVWVSDNASVKRRAAHDINRNTEEAMKKWNIPAGKKPSVVFVNPKEINNALGKYDSVTHTVYYSTEIADKKLMEKYGGLGITEYHEMWHLRQAEEYRKAVGEITEETREKYVCFASERSKVNLDKLGITENTIVNLSPYAKKSLFKGRYDEIEAEYMAYHRGE